MCNRLNQWVTPSQLQEFFDTVRTPDFEPRYNVSPADPVVYIAASADGREARIGEFGFSPIWSDYRFEWVLPGHGQKVHLPAAEMRSEILRLVESMRNT